MLSDMVHATRTMIIIWCILLDYRACGDELYKFIPSQDRLSEPRLKPGSQVHWNPPMVLLQFCSQPLAKLHSSMSVQR